MSVVNPSHVQKPLDSEDSKPVLESHLVLLRTCEFSDVTFIVGMSKERIPCHQLFLKARSPVFKAMFSERWNQGHKDISLEDDDPKIFHKFLEFIYADIIVASVSKAMELLQVAHKYDVQLLVSKCEQVLGSHVMFDDAIDVFQVAGKYEMTQLMNKVWDLMAQSQSHLQFLPSFSRMDKRTLTDLLQSNDLKMTEVDLFRLAMKWASNQDSLVAEQSHIMEDVLPLIRFPLMSLEEFTRVVVPTGLLSESALIQVFTYFGTDTETKKTLASKMNFSTQQRAVDDDGKFALYSAVFTNCPSRQQKYMQLRENLWFEVGEILDVGLFNRELQGGSSLVKRRTEEKKKHVFMFTISLYCPRTTASMNSGIITSSLTKRFHIEVTSHCVDTEKLYKTFCEQKNVEIEEGNILEVKLALWVPLESGKLYCISVKESPQPGMPYDCGAYEARDFGDIQKNITTAIGDKCVRFLNIRRNHHPCGFGGTNAGPNMIYKLGLIDMEIKY